MSFISCLHHVYAVYTMVIPGFMWCLYYIYTSWFYHDYTYYTMIIPCSYSVCTMNIPCLYCVCTMLIPCLHHDYQHVYSIPCLCHAYTKFKQWLYDVYTDTWYMIIVLSCFYDVFIPCLYPLLPNGHANFHIPHLCVGEPSSSAVPVMLVATTCSKAEVSWDCHAS